MITGNCGISLVPLLSDNPIAPLSLLGTGQFRLRHPRRLRRGPAEGAAGRVNVAGALIGYTAVRASVVADLDGPATAEERIRMAELVSQAMDEGALGLSSGVFYQVRSLTPTGAGNGGSSPRLCRQRRPLRGPHSR